MRRGKRRWLLGSDFLIGQLKMEEHCDGTYRIQRLFFGMSDDLWEIYQEKKDEVKAGEFVQI